MLTQFHPNQTGGASYHRGVTPPSAFARFGNTRALAATAAGTVRNVTVPAVATQAALTGVPQQDGPTLRIVYNNDPHEKLQAMPYITSGFKYFSHEGEALGMDVLRLNSGDNNIGNNPREWDLNVLLKNLLEYHAVTTGNHEFDLGTFLYARGLRNANFPTLISNLEYPEDGALAQKIRQKRIQNHPLVINGKHGVYGVLGVMTPQLKSVLSSTVDLQGVEVEDWDDTVEDVEEQVEELKKQGVNKIILLSHMGFEYEKKLVKAVDGIDIVIGGHSHDVLNGIVPGVNYLQSRSGDPTLIVQAGKNAQWMGVVDAKFDRDGRLMPISHKLYSPFQFAQDAQSVAIRNAFLGAPKPLANITNAIDEGDNAFRPDPVAQFSADTLRTVSGADIAFVRASEIRNNVKPGWFTDQDLNELLPFPDQMVRVRLTGAEIMQALAVSARCLREHDTHPGMLHASGLAVTMSKSQGRVVSAMLFNKALNRWEPLNPSRYYTVATGEFGVTNKREFPSMNHPERIDWRSGTDAKTVFAKGLQMAGAPARPITFRDDGRLLITP